MQLRPGRVASAIARESEATAGEAVVCAGAPWRRGRAQMLLDISLILHHKLAVETGAPQVEVFAVLEDLDDQLL